MELFVEGFDFRWIQWFAEVVDHLLVETGDGPAEEPLGFAVDGVKARLSNLVGLVHVGLVEEDHAEIDADVVGILRDPVGENVIQHQSVDMVGDRTRRTLCRNERQRVGQARRTVRGKTVLLVLHILQETVSTRYDMMMSLAADGRPGPPLDP